MQKERTEGKLTKSEALAAFGWVPKEQRSQNTLLQNLKERGIVSKSQVKDYVVNVAMPKQELGLRKKMGVSHEPKMEEIAKKNRATRMRKAKILNDFNNTNEQKHTKQAIKSKRSLQIV